MRILILVFIMLCGHGWAAEQTVIDQYIQQTFGAEPPKICKVWLTESVLQNDLKKILERSEIPLRQRYYQLKTKRLWLLDEIGKECAITIGIITENNAIIEEKVLIYRETRGAEVQQQVYLDQFSKLTLKDNLELSQSVDGITGATLSCRALTKMARYALRLEKYLNQP